MVKKSITSLVVGSVILVWLLNPARAQIAKDKQLHFKAGLFLSGVFYMVHTYGPNFDGKGMSKVEYRQLRRAEALRWSLGITVAAGALKELSDAAGAGTPEWNDLLYTLYGGLAGSLLCLILDHTLSKSFDFMVDAANQRLALKYKFK